MFLSKKNIVFASFPIIIILFLIPLLDWLRITTGLLTFNKEFLDVSILMDHFANFWNIFSIGLIRRIDELPSLAFTIDNIDNLQRENINIWSHITFEGLIPSLFRDPQFNEQRLVLLMDKYGFRELLNYDGSSPMTFIGELYFFGKEFSVYTGSLLAGLIFSLYDNYIFKNFISPKSAFIFGFLCQGLFAISTSPIPTIIATLSKQVIFAYLCYFLLKKFSVIRKLDL